MRRQVGRRGAADHHRRPTTYQHPETERRVDAVTKGWFIKNVVCAGLHFDEDALKQVDGELLKLAYRLVTGSAA